MRIGEHGSIAVTERVNYKRNLPEPLSKDAKTVPTNIERKVFKDTRVVSYRLKDAT